MSSNIEHMNRILIIEPNWLGDILFTTPAIRALRRSNPGAFIGVMAHPRCAEMLEDNPCVDRLILFDERSSHRGVIKKVFFILGLRRLRFDTVISFHRSMSRMLIAYLSRIPKRVGYYTKKRSWLLTERVYEENRQIHRVEYFSNILKRIGIDIDNGDYEFFIPECAAREATAVLEKAGVQKDERFFVINPGGNWHAKRWPKQNYAKLCERLYAIYKRRILVTGAEKDIVLASEIIRLSGDYAINICGKTTLKQLAVVMRKASLVIANDTGPMHIALSQKAPVIALFGPTSPDVTGPYGRGRYTVLHKWSYCDVPCYKACQDYRCMEAISVEDVISASEGLLALGRH
jgi:heptosyltransferase II